MRKGDKIKYRRWFHNLATNKQGYEIIDAVYLETTKNTAYKDSDYIVKNLTNNYICGIGKEQIINHKGGVR